MCSKGCNDKVHMDSEERLKIPYVLDKEDANRLLAIQRLLDDEDTWSDIETTLGIGSLYHWTRRKVGEVRSTSVEKVNNKVAASVSNYNKMERTSTEKASQQVIQSDLPDYGELPATGYVSDLNNDDWMEKYCGYTWDRDYLTQMRDEIWTRFLLLMLLPRGHGKTWSMIALFTRFIIEKGEQVLVFTNSGMKSTIFNGVKKFLMSPEVRQDYGDVIETSRENKGEIWLVDSIRRNHEGIHYNDASLIVIGKTAESVGKHPSWIHLEDIIQNTAVSDLTRKRLERWFTSNVSYMAHSETKITATGTRKGINDFYNFLLEEHHFPVMRMEALEIVSGRLPKKDECVVNHEKKVIEEYPEDVGEYEVLDCPDWPLKRLLYKFMFKYASAEAEMNNNPVPPGGLFFPEHAFKVIDGIKGYMNYFIVVDPGFSKSESSSGSAILVIGIHKGKMIVVDAVIDKLSMSELNRHVKDLHTKYGPQQTIVENNWAQITSKSDKFKTILNLRGIRLIENFTDKFERITALEFPLSRNDILFLSTCGFLDKIEFEVKTFDPHDPEKSKMNYNALDALVIGYDKLEPFMNRYTQGSNKMGSKGGLKAGSYSSGHR